MQFLIEMLSYWKRLYCYNASMRTDHDMYKMQYTLLRENHIIEKGMSMRQSRRGFGQAYIGAASVLAILAFKVIGDALSQTSGQLIIIEGIQKYAPVRNIIGCVACIILNLILIKHYGIHGAAYTALITTFLSGTFANFLIPSYNRIFYKQLKAICVGWKDIMHIKTILR